jgi:hypothetical protein
MNISMFLMEEVEKLSYHKPIVPAELPITRQEILNMLRTHDEASFPSRHVMRSQSNQQLLGNVSNGSIMPTHQTMIVHNTNVGIKQSHLGGINESTVSSTILTQTVPRRTTTTLF